MRAVAVLAFGVLCLYALPMSAEMVGEGVQTVRCVEEGDPGDIALPKRMEFVQTIVSQAFEASAQVALGFDVDYNDASVRGGKVIATAYRIEADGSETKLGKMVGKPKNGEVEKLKIVDARLLSGEQILWQVRLKKVSGLDAGSEACWELALFVVVADELPD